jgi:hypothetical protein
MKRFVRPLLSLAVLGYMCYLTNFLATAYQIPRDRSTLPFVVWFIDTVDIFVHEAGHLFFTPAGDVLYYLGGSIIQVVLPMAAAILLLGISTRSLSYCLYWLGHNLANISVYIADAPKLELKMYSFHGLHDWYLICTTLGIMDQAGKLAQDVLYAGIISCVIGIGLGLFWVVVDLRGLMTPASYFGNSPPPGRS